MSQRDIGAFLDDMIRARIGIRLIAEQHLALHQETAEHMVGVVNSAVEPAVLIRDSGDIVREMCEVHYGSAPELLIDGDQRMTFAYIPVHLEYLMTELLKNAYRATVEQSARANRFPHPP
ncbi:MAG: hypothetical protein BJ554DRAFT_2282 [Olpidium bornovanus]|uniref:Protein-serine/threonine kinase n=1 Tax=Olpidium bornovanus TaxID=278681 RepID=A0A8H8DGF2_9FUNG|nr:MAG: hypothetical protein BJ554DRAFT_2282 [Olpidium bornovanus]